MIVFDLRQDSLEKSKVLSDILEASGVFSSESKTSILNSNSHLLMKEQNKDAQTLTYPTSKSPHTKSSGATISFVMDSKEHRSVIFLFHMIYSRRKETDLYNSMKM